ncbi:MAG: TonB-dependent receptor [Saprospiraceae bacterium]|nr:MAG: TonB-dependent receptor [Saprospiraceae bacterium]
MKKIIYTLLILGLCLSLQAQSLQGRVIDSSNQPIADAYIFTPSGDIHSHSDALGKFVCRGLKVGDTLKVSFLGFKTIEKTLAKEDFTEELKFVLQEAFFELDQVFISNSVKSANQVAAIDLQTNPVNSSQEILRKIPGLIIGQHAGGGKAEQIFLRGFDIDHGTDIAINVDGLPVNMVSHAHGQGYADLHFLIPETIENINFGKGPYYTDHGNFTTAGFVDFKTKDQLDQSTIGLQYGQFNTFRTFGLFDILGQSENQHAYIATEYSTSDGPFESSQNFNRLNLMGKYAVNFNNNDRLSVLVSRFQSKWDASGQIPQRLVDNGTISRFGSVDDTEGGNTDRTNVLLEHTKVISNQSFVKTKAFYSKYNFELFSNFTFFLEDPVNGDQIKQKEHRNIYGIESTVFQSLSGNSQDITLSYGVGLRYDDVDGNELSHTLNRKTTLVPIALGNVDETNLYTFINAEFDFGKWLINPGIRADAFTFDYVNQLNTEYTSLSERKAIVSPKLNIIYNPNQHWQFFLKSGMGFHSNDTRVVVAQNGQQILPAAYGVDLGAVWKPSPRLWINAGIWYLQLQQEFVYVGDAGIVEPSGKTERQGIETGLRWQLSDYLFFDSDINYTHARAIGEPEGENFIPLAPDLTAAGGFSFHHPSGFSAGIRYRYIKDRPANEDNSIVAKGYFITDLNANYTFNKKVTIGASVENLFDQKWNEAQFATESRLFSEQESVEEIHFTPGVPFFLKASLQYHF